MLTKRDIVNYILKNNVYQMGDVILKSGRTSDHIFNFGKVCSSSALAELATMMVSTATDDFTAIFTSAYKGIMISAAMLCECNTCFPSAPIKMGYLRKERKDHGEGGNVIGYIPKENEAVLLVDDVLTTGQSLIEMAEFINSNTKAYVDSAIVVVSRMSIDEVKDLQAQLKFPINYLITDDEFQTIFDSQFTRRLKSK